MKAIIMAGGKGTRLAALAADIPKPMVPISNKPILEHQIKCLKLFGITEILMVIGHLGHVIKNYFDNGEKWGVKITYFVEEKPLGTAGGLYYLSDYIDDTTLLVFGDIFFDIDVDKFIKHHKEKKADITLFVHPNSHPYDSDLIQIDSNGYVIKWDSKNNIRNYDYNNLVNAGIYVLTKKIFKYIVSEQKLDLEQNVIIPMIKNGEKVSGYVSTEYAKDCGTIDRYDSINLDYNSGVIAAKNLSKPQKCVFLDRDGTINEYVGLLTKPEQLKLINDVAEAIRLINKSEYLCIIISNQPVIARGECSFNRMDEIHKKLYTLLGKEHAYVDDLFYCPHHPHSGYEGEIKELKFDCECRKPKIKMLLDASKKHNIQLEKSYMVGDTTIDIMTAKNTEMKSILVQTGLNGSDQKYNVQADYVAKDLLSAVKLILAKK